MKKLFIFHLKRSGGHAIINWLGKLSQNYLHINDCGIDEKRNIVTTGFCNDNGNVRLFDTDYKLNNYNLVIYSFEDRNIQKIKDHKDARYITIIRDPYNTLASRYKKSKETYLAFPNDLWLQHVMYSETKNIIIINYNNWFKDKCYRVKVASDLGLTYYDSGINDVNWYGKSSFDHYQYDGKAQEMKVLERWKTYANRKDVWEQLTPAVKEIASYYFEETKEIEKSIAI